MSKTHHWKVDGMTCGNCALSVSKYFKQQGVEGVVANAASGEVSFTTNVDEEGLVIYQKGLSELGYPVLQMDGVEAAELKEASNFKKWMTLKKMMTISIIFTIPLLFHMFVGADNILNNPTLQLILTLPVYVIGMYYFGTSAFRSLKNGIPNMDVLITIGSSAAFIYSLAGMFLIEGHAHEFLFFETTATIITFVLIGNWVEQRAVTSTTSSIRELAALQPMRAQLIMKDSIGKETLLEVNSKDLKVGDCLQINDGHSIPVDGTLEVGVIEVDESMLTGESQPVFKKVGDQLTGGTVVVSGNGRMIAKEVGETTVLAQIIDLVRKAQAVKPPMQKLADRISAVFVPLVLSIALLTFILNFWLLEGDLVFQNSIMRAIAVLVIACPCAMGLATPAAVAVGMGRAARNGILIKGADTLEKFKDIQQIVFDKTGTLTTGALAIKEFHAEGIQDDLFKSIVVSMEAYSTHPIANSIVKQWAEVPRIAFEEVWEEKGLGLFAKDKEGATWKLGSYHILKEQKDAKWDIHLTKNEEYVGSIALEDELRKEAVSVIKTLHDQGYETVLLSGDRKEKAVPVGQELGIDRVIYEQKPDEKLAYLSSERERGQVIVMVGDGINDAPALATADIGVSLSDATQVAMQSANVVLSSNSLSGLPKAIKLGRYTYTTIKQNLFWAFFYNVSFIPFAALGYLSPIWAAVIMAMSDVVLIINSLRLNIRKLE